MWLFLGIMQFSFALLVKAGGGGHDNHADHIFFCLTSQCVYDDVCRLRNTNGHLIGHCISKHAEPLNADHDGCPQLLGEGSECFCNIHNCDHHTQAATGHHTTTTTNHNDLVCGDHVCHGHQYCIIEEKQDGKLHLNCADVHNTQHCLPNLLSNGSLCFCDTRICVDHTLISIVAGHQVAGLICSDDDDHSCPADYVCEISMYKNGIRKHCGDGHHMTQCTQLPINYHEKCYCATQSCVFGQFSATTTMSITSKLTTAGPTVAASTTIQQTTVQPTTVQVYTSVPTTGNMHVIPSNASITLAVANTPTIQAASTVFISSLKNTCSDNEDTNFSCIVYEMKYGLCTATTGTLYRIAHKRCQAYCGICSGNSTSVPQQASLPTQPTCIDHDARCSQYQQQICSSTVSKNYVISTCPKSCNKCAEYLASLNPQLVTTTSQPVTNTAPSVTTKAQQVTTTANPITTTPKPVTKTAAPTTTAQSVTTTTTVVCQDKPGVDCKLFNIDFCANPYSNTICAKSCGHCTKVIQSAFG